MRHLGKKALNIKCFSPVQGVQDLGIQHDP